METTRTKKKVIVNFANTQELIEYIKQAPKAGNSRKERDQDFCSYEWDETLEALSSGWKESKQIKINADTLNVMGTGTGYTTEYDVVGDFLDIGTHLSGVPECWGSMIEEPRAMKKAKILVDLFTSWRKSQEEVGNRGSAIISLIDRMREAGYFLEIELRCRMIGVVPNDTYFEYGLTVSTDNGYSRDMLAFLVAHPGSFRRVGFAIMEVTQDHSNMRGYGKAPYSQDPLDSDIYFQPTSKDPDGTWYSIESSKRKIDSMLENYERKA